MGGTFKPWVYSRSTVRLTSRPAATPQPPALPPLAPGAMIRASCLHPRTPHWCSATVGASQVSGRQSGRPSSPPSRRDWCQGCALPGRLPSSPARHPVEPVPGVRGQAFWGESVCPMLPWRQLFPRPTVELPEGSSWARAGDGESTGMCLPSCHHHTPLGAAVEPWANLHRCPLDGYCFTDPRCLGLNRNFSCKMQSPSLCPQLGSVLTTHCALSWALYPS